METWLRAHTKAVHSDNSIETMVHEGLEGLTGLVQVFHGVEANCKFAHYSVQYVRRVNVVLSASLVCQYFGQVFSAVVG